MLTRISNALVFYLLRYRNIQFWLIMLAALAIVIILNYARICARRRGKTLFWLACGLAGISLVITAGLYWTRLPRGLAARYFANSVWVDDGTDLDRFFDANGDGQRVDRFIDFQPNDFNNEYPFTGDAMSVRWQGSVYIPTDGVRVILDTQNVGAWLRIDDDLVEGQHRLDFGASSARTYLRAGWSRDEVWGSGEPFTFVWGLEDRSEFYLGLDEIPPDAVRLVFRCAPFQQPDTPQQALIVSIDDQQIGTVALNEGWQTYALPIPKQVIHDTASGFLRITFAYAHAISQSQDPRPLRVAFDFAWLQNVSGTSASSLTEPVIEALPVSPPLSKGVHTIDLKISTQEAKDLRIRLLWQPDADRAATVIPEDALFPAGLEAERILRAWPAERAWLGFSLLIMLSIVAFLIWLIAWGILAAVDYGKLITREGMILSLICVGAFVIRALLIFEMKRIDPNFDILPRGTDHLTYVIYARGFLRGFWPGLFHQPFHGAPLISFYLILCAVLFGEKLIFARLATAAMTSLTIWFVYKICHQTFPQSRAIAYLAAILCACNGVLIFYDTSLLLEPLLTFLSVVSVYLMGRLRQHISAKNAILLGVCLGLTALARTNILLIMPFLALWMFVAFPSTLLKKAGVYVLVCLCLAATIAPVTIRNYYAGPRHEFVLTNGNGGIMLWLSNNPTANGAGGFSSKLADDVRNRISQGQTSYAQEVIRYIAAEPWNYVNLLYHKLKLFWRGYEIANLIPYYVFRHASKLLGLPWINFVVIAPLGLVGMALAVKYWKPAGMLYSYVLIQMATTLIFHALARYRIPTVPILTVFAAYTLWRIGQTLQAKQWRRAVLIAGTVIALYLVINVPHAARLYRQHHGEALPWPNVLRYWDLFHTW